MMPRLRSHAAYDALLHYLLGVSVIGAAFADTDNCNEVVLLQGSYRVVKASRETPRANDFDLLHRQPMISEHDVHSLAPEAWRLSRRRNISSLDHELSFDVCEEMLDGRCSMHSCSDDTIVLPKGFISRNNPIAMPLISGDNPGVFCAISHKYQFIFVHVLRNAGTSTKAWLQQALCGKTQECDPDVLHMDSCHSLLTNYSGYFRWSWKRPVYDRAASIYNMAKNYNMADNVSFADFWLAGMDRWLLTDLSRDHGRSQTEFLRNADGCSAVDFLGSLTNIDADMKKLLEKLDVPELNTFYATHGFKKPKHDVFGKMTKTTGLELVLENPAAYPALKKILLQEFEKDLGWCGE